MNQDLPPEIIVWESCPYWQKDSYNRYFSRDWRGVVTFKLNGQPPSKYDIDKAYTRPLKLTRYCVKCHLPVKECKCVKGLRATFG